MAKFREGEKVHFKADVLYKILEVKPVGEDCSFYRIVGINESTSIIVGEERLMSLEEKAEEKAKERVGSE